MNQHICIVTGAASGIGLAISELCTLVNDVRPETKK